MCIYLIYCMPYIIRVLGIYRTSISSIGVCIICTICTISIVFIIAFVCIIGINQYRAGPSSEPFLCSYSALFPYISRHYSELYSGYRRKWYFENFSHLSPIFSILGIFSFFFMPVCLFFKQILPYFCILFSSERISCLYINQGLSINRSQGI